VELPQAPARLDGRWLLIGLASAVAAYGLVQAMGQPSGGPQAELAASAGLGTLLGMRRALEPDHRWGHASRTWRCLASVRPWAWLRCRATWLADCAGWDPRYRRAQCVPSRRMHLDYARPVLGLSSCRPLVLDCARVFALGGCVASIT